MSDDLNDMKQQLRAAAAALRPSIELVVETIGNALRALPGGTAVPVMQGPVTWTWVDARGKVYAVAPSAEHDGYPMLTIRQPIAVDLDAWLTTCSIMIGPDANTILNSATLAIVNHTGAYAGYESTVRAVVAGGGALAGMDRACEIAGRDPVVISAVASAIRGADDDKDPGGLN